MINVARCVCVCNNKDIQYKCVEYLKIPYLCEVNVC